VSGVPPNPLSSGRAGGGLVSEGRTTASYDFLRPPKLAREHLRTLDAIADTFAHRLALLLTARLRKVCRVSTSSIKQVSVGEHIASLDDLLVLAPIALDPLPGSAQLEMSLEAAMTTLDYLLGGSGGTQPRRPLTDIETPLLRDVLDGALTELRLAFEEVTPIEPALGPLGYRPLLDQFGGPTDPLVICAFDLVIGESTSVLSLCLPLQALLPALQRYLENEAVSAGERAVRQAAKDLLTARLNEVPVEVTAVFAPIRLLSDQLVDLRPGDVVPLDHPVDLPLDITSAGEVFGRAVPTQRGQRLACQVVATDEEPSA
jgi:flagellar motor switch protein FliM